MGIRETQDFGLTAKARDWLSKRVHTSRKRCDCPHCASDHLEVSSSHRYGDARSLGMFDDGPDLYMHWVGDRWVYEQVQHSHWSSGPMIFLALYDAEGRPLKFSLWENKDMELGPRDEQHPSPRPASNEDGSPPRRLTEPQEKGAP